MTEDQLIDGIKLNDQIRSIDNYASDIKCSIVNRLSSNRTGRGTLFTSEEQVLILNEIDILLNKYIDAKKHNLQKQFDEL